MNNHIKVKQRRFEMQVETSDKRSCIADSLLRGEAIVLSKSPKPINRLKGWSSSDTVAYPRCILILTFVCLQTLQRRGPSGSQSSRARASCPQSAGRGRATLHTGHPSFTVPWMGLDKRDLCMLAFPKYPLSIESNEQDRTLRTSVDLSHTWIRPGIKLVCAVADRSSN